MLSNLPEHIRDRVYLSLVLVAGILRFINLDFLDLQAWDESLYAVRAIGILKFGGWLDQSSFAVDGLYSSLHPPLHVWTTAVAFKLVGISEFSARCVSAVAGILTLVLVYRIGKKLAASEVGLLAALLVGLNPFVSFFARQGQFDATLVFFLTAAVYVLIEKNNQHSLSNAMLAGLAVGAALMTKLYVGFGIPLAYALSIFFIPKDNRSQEWKHLGRLTLVAILIAAPWHMYMTVMHGNGDLFFIFKASALWERSFSGIEGNIKPLEVFYFINQLFVLFPAGVLWFAYGFWNLIREKNREWMILVCWFAVFFVIFSLVRTKLAVYILPMLVPCAFIAAREMWKAVSGEMPRKILTVLTGGTLFSVLWSSNQSWRNGIKELILMRVDASLIFSLLPFFGLALLVFGVTYYCTEPSRISWLRKSLFSIVVVPSFLLSLYYFAIVDTTQYKDGGKELADFINENGIEQILVAGYERNPQLSYYLDGADIGWREDVRFRRIIPPKDSSQFRIWLINETTFEPATALLVIEKDKFIRYNIIDPIQVVPSDYGLVLETRRYACFQKMELVRFAQVEQDVFLQQSRR
ncbi:MAG TPA: glycosyltransferase family 39 protein [Bacteroidota bacterium]